MKPSSTRNIAALTLASTLLLGAASFAQNEENQLAVATQKRVVSLVQFAGKGVRDLNLSAAQQAKLKSIAQRNAPLIRQIWSNDSLSPAQKTGKVRALQAETSAVFTPVQKQRIEAVKSGAMMKMFETASWISSELELSSAQQEKIQRIAMKSYRQSRGTGGSFGALRSMMLDANREIDATLTASQRAKWNIIKITARREFTKNARVLAAMSGV